MDFEGETRLTHKIPAGPEITAPADGAVVPHDEPLFIRWNKVTGPILPDLGPVRIVGYHVVVKDVSVPELSGPLPPPQFDVDVAKNETSVVVPEAVPRAEQSLRVRGLGDREGCQPDHHGGWGFLYEFRKLLQIASCRNWRNARNHSAQKPARRRRMPTPRIVSPAYPPMTDFYCNLEEFQGLRSARLFSRKRRHSSVSPGFRCWL